VLIILIFSLVLGKVLYKFVGWLFHNKYGQHKTLLCHIRWTFMDAVFTNIWISSIRSRQSATGGLFSAAQWPYLYIESVKWYTEVGVHVHNLLFTIRSSCGEYWCCQACMASCCNWWWWGIVPGFSWAGIVMVAWNGTLLCWGVSQLEHFIYTSIAETQLLFSKRWIFSNCRMVYVDPSPLVRIYIMITVMIRTHADILEWRVC